MEYGRCVFISAMLFIGWSKAQQGCSFDEFRCKTQGTLECIHRRHKCNGNPDCSDNSDEEGCHDTVPAFLIYSTYHLSYASGKIQRLELGTYHSIYLRMGDYHSTWLPTRKDKVTSLDFIWQPDATYLFMGCMDGSIKKGTLIGNAVTDIKTIITSGTGSVNDIAVDWLARRLFWTNSILERIEMTYLDDVNRTTLLHSNMSQPWAIVVDPIEGWLFWTDLDTKNPRIERCSLNGEQRSIIHTINWDEGGGRPLALTVDYDLHCLYWIDSRSDTLKTISYNGQYSRVLLKGHDSLTRSEGMSVYGDTLYSANKDNYSIFEASKHDGSDLRIIGKTGNTPSALKVVHISSQARSRCDVKNSGCTDLCLQNRNNTVTCSCPHEKYLEADGKTCTLKPPTTTTYLVTTTAEPTCDSTGSSDVLTPLGFDYSLKRMNLLLNVSFPTSTTNSICVEMYKQEFEDLFGLRQAEFIALLKVHNSCTSLGAYVQFISVLVTPGVSRKEIAMTVTIYVTAMKGYSCTVDVVSCASALSYTDMTDAYCLFRVANLDVGEGCRPLQTNGVVMSIVNMQYECADGWWNDDPNNHSCLPPSCPARSLYDEKRATTVKFSATRVGEKAYSWERCYNGSGALATAVCDSGYDNSSSWSPVVFNVGCKQFPELENSSSTNNLRKLSKTNMTHQNVDEILKDTVNLTVPDINLKEADIIYTADILYNYWKIAHTIQLDSPLDNVYDIFNNAIQSSPDAIAKAQHLNNAPNRLIRTVDDLTNELTSPGTKTIVRSFVATTSSLQSGHCDLVIGLQLEHSTNVEISKEILLPMKSPVDVRDASTDTAIYLSRNIVEGTEARLTFNIFSKTGLFATPRGSFVVNRKVTAARLVRNNQSVTDLGDDRVTAIFKMVEDFENIVCGWWDYSANEDTGGWKTEGCVLSRNGSKVTCECGHLTNFAVLIDLKADKILATHKYILAFVTKIGLSISITACGFNVLTFLIFT